MASALVTCSVNRMKACEPRDKVFTAVTLMRSREIASEMSRSKPWRSSATTSRSAENGASAVLPQSAAISRSRWSSRSPVMLATIAAVHQHAAGPRDESDDGIGRHRLAALGDQGRDVVHAEHEHARRSRARARRWA
jgi:hypothetical protein